MVLFTCLFFTEYQFITYIQKHVRVIRNKTSDWNQYEIGHHSARDDAVNDQA